MSPERRALLIEALIAIHDQEFFGGGRAKGSVRPYIEALSDAELTVKIANIEALIERAQQTDV